MIEKEKEIKSERNVNEKEIVLKENNFIEKERQLNEKVKRLLERVTNRERERVWWVKDRIRVCVCDRVNGCELLL